MTTTTIELRAWVGCLGCYNDGNLVGKWVDGIEAENVTIAELHEGDRIPKNIYTEMHEELWCFDHEGYGGGEFSPMEATRIARYFEEAESDGVDLGALRAWIDNESGYRGKDWADDRDSFGDDFYGTYGSEKEFAESFAYDTGQISDDSPLSSYIDWERVWESDFHCDSWWSAKTADYDVYIFRSS